MRELLETNLCSRNLIEEINTGSVSIVRYHGPFLKWTKEELKQMDQRTRKLMTMYKALHHRDDEDRLYVSRKEGERRLACIKESVGALIRRLEDYFKKCKESLITVTRNSTDNRTTIARKQKGKKTTVWIFRPTN